MCMNPKAQLLIKPTPTQTFISVGLLLLAGLGFTLSVLISRMALEDGVSLNAANAMRYVVATALLMTAQRFRTQKIELQRRERVISLALGVPIFIMGVGYLGATQYIPVSLAVLIFYTCPFFVAVIARFTENEPITITRLAAIIIAFIGIAFAMNVPPTAAFKLVGVVFALMAAIGFAGFVTISSLMLKTTDRQAILLNGLAAGTFLFVLFFVLTNGLEITGTGSGWLKVSGSGALVAFAYLAFFSGIKMIGPVKASMIMNIEPVLTIVLAAILLGERLSHIQSFGAVLVIGAIVFITASPRNP